MRATRACGVGMESLPQTAISRVLKHCSPEEALYFAAIAKPWKQGKNAVLICDAFSESLESAGSAKSVNSLVQRLLSVAALRCLDLSKANLPWSVVGLSTLMQLLAATGPDLEEVRISWLLLPLGENTYAVEGSWRNSDSLVLNECGLTCLGEVSPPRQSECQEYRKLQQRFSSVRFIDFPGQVRSADLTPLDVVFRQCVSLRSGRTDLWYNHVSEEKRARVSLERFYDVLDLNTSNPMPYTSTLDWDWFRIGRVVRPFPDLAECAVEFEKAGSYCRIQWTLQQEDNGCWAMEEWAPLTNHH